MKKKAPSKEEVVGIDPEETAGRMSSQEEEIFPQRETS